MRNSKLNSFLDTGTEAATMMIMVAATMITVVDTMITMAATAMMYMVGAMMITVATTIMEAGTGMTMGATVAGVMGKDEFNYLTLQTLYTLTQSKFVPELHAE